MFKIMTFNIRIDVAVDKENGWPFRKEAVARYINKEKPIILGIQEANQKMMNELMSLLPMYDFIGIPREEGTEYSAILYLKEVAKCTLSNTFWLSDTPLKSSKYTESAFPRIATYGRFIIYGKEYVFINTHLDYLKEEIAFKQIQVLQKETDGLSEEMILMGDFNFPPQSMIHKFLTSHGWILPYKEDCLSQASFHAFEGVKTGMPIDYIYGKKKVHFLQVKIDQDTVNPICLSDHYPVIAFIE